MGEAALTWETLLAAWQMWVTIGAIGIAILVYSTDRYSIELVSGTIIAFFLLFFYFFPPIGTDGQVAATWTTILQGFANSALLAILALLIIGQGLYHAGALEQPTQVLVRWGRKRPHLTLLTVLVSVAVVSAFLNNTPVVVMFVPVIAAIVLRSEMAPSKYMMSLSFMSVLGGMTTLIGSSTNLLTAEAASRVANIDINFFDFTLPGLALAAVGAVYVLFLLPRFLPDTKPLTRSVAEPGRQFLAQIVLTPGHPLIGKVVDGSKVKDLKDMTITAVQRDETPIRPPFHSLQLKEGDVIVVATGRQALADLLSAKPEFLHGMVYAGIETESGAKGDGAEAPKLPRGSDLMIAEAVVAPGSRMAGFSIANLGFRHLTSCIVLGIQRRSRMIRDHYEDIRLEPGDVLLILGRRPDIKALRTNRDVLVLEWASLDLPFLANANKARAIFVGVVAAAAFGIVPIVIAALAGAVAMVGTGCLNVRQAARAIDRRIFLLIAAALAMGTALDVTGGAEFLAHSLVASLEEKSVPLVLSAFFLMVAVTTNVLSNNATAVLFTPIAISTAQQLGVDPLIFVYAVIFASNCSFATPIAYQTNLLVMGPGQYRFTDFIWAGAPLILILWLFFSLFGPWYFGIASWDWWMALIPT